MRVKCAGVLLVLAVLASRATAQGLGGAADQERKRREALAKERGPTRVLTDRDINPAGDWIGWREWQPPDGSFAIQMPSRPVVERDEVGLSGSTQTVPRVYYHARDQDGWEYWVSVIDYPADYVRFQAGRIRSDFPMSGLLQVDRNDAIVQRGSQLGGREIQVLYGTRFQLVGGLFGTRYYQLLARVAPGDQFAHQELHHFFRSFQP
jgi:hypothetical protein